MEPLPCAAGGDCGGLIKPVADEDDAERGRGRQLHVARHGEPIGVAGLGAHVGQKLGERRHCWRQAGGLERDAVAMGLDLASA